ncbi:MAG: 2-oxoacid:acceptor oxidoreductase subunit alpha [Chloroflexi bacterium]|nr:2-oxoacid:acceptor oxidoreductase subunit alpha [Chloroflexota bacterium]
MAGGEAGQGVQTIGYVLSKALARGGFHVFADQDYESRIRGGHNFFRIRARDSEVRTLSEAVDVLVALNQETIDLHRGEMGPKGIMVLDEGAVKAAGDDGRFCAVPFQRLAEESAQNKLMANTVAVGAALALVGYDLGILRDVVAAHFGAKSGEANAAAAKAGYDYVTVNFKGDLGKRLAPRDGQRRMLLTGNEAIAVGAIASGCKFVAGYPMTPTTSILEYIAGKADEFGMVMVQPEDEIAAVNMVIGAAFTGARSMTATSGGGFCLMVEGLGLAGMTETPIVIVEGQRPGPAIGLPTREEQGDLEFVLHASHGEFPRAVLAPATVEDCFWLTVKAFNLADKYQMPVLILTDHALATSYATVPKFDLSQVKIERGEVLSAAELARVGEYKRHRITASGISPRAFPLEGTALVVTDSDEHNEEGHIIEDAETRTAMMLKRLRKLEGARKEISGPRTYGPKQADATLIGWGSTYGAICEAVDLANRDGLNPGSQSRMKLNAMHFNEIWPFPAAATAGALQGVKKSIAVENNATGQFAHLLRAETGHQVDGKVLRFDGRPLSPAFILSELRREVS